MAISTYAELKTAVSNWLERPEAVNRIPEFIALGEARIYSNLRIREMEATTTITTVNAQQTTEVPARFREAKRLYVDDTSNTVLEYRDEHSFWAIYSSLTSGQPAVYTIEAENFVWGPTPDQAYSIPLLYWQGLAGFSDDADTNAILDKYPGVYLYAALLEASLFYNEDSDILKYARMLDAGIADANRESERDRTGGWPRNG